jgi:hypothetical protein
LAAVGTGFGAGLAAGIGLAAGFGGVVVFGATRGGFGAAFAPVRRGADFADVLADTFGDAFAAGPDGFFGAGRGIGFAPFFAAAGRGDFVGIGELSPVGYNGVGRPCG